MDLEGQQSLELTFAGLVVDRLRRDLSVDGMDQMVSACDDAIIVPLGHIDRHRRSFLCEPFLTALIDDDRLTVLGEDAPSPLVVEHCVVFRERMDITLISTDRVRSDL